MRCVYDVGSWAIPPRDVRTPAGSSRSDVTATAAETVLRLAPATPRHPILPWAAVGRKSHPWAPQGSGQWHMGSLGPLSASCGLPCRIVLLPPAFLSACLHASHHERPAKPVSKVTARSVRSGGFRRLLVHTTACLSLVSEDLPVQAGRQQDPGAGARLSPPHPREPTDATWTRSGDGWTAAQR